MILFDLCVSCVFTIGGGNGGFNMYKYHYPASRTQMAEDNTPIGVIGMRIRSHSHLSTDLILHLLIIITVTIIYDDDYYYYYYYFIFLTIMTIIIILIMCIFCKGNVELLNSKVISTQPIVSFDWSPDKDGLCVLSCLDQTIRVFIVTKLNKY